MNNSDAPRIAAAATRSVDGSAAQIAEAAVTAWQARVAALAPVIGQRGVAALYGRSLALACEEHAWLAGAQQAVVQSAMDLPALKTVLSRRSAIDAEAGGQALSQRFRALLESLIGPSLTERLLASTADTPSSGGLGQETPP